MLGIYDDMYMGVVEVVCGGVCVCMVFVVGGLLELVMCCWLGWLLVWCLVTRPVVALLRCVLRVVRCLRGVCAVLCGVVRCCACVQSGVSRLTPFVS